MIQSLKRPILNFVYKYGQLETKAKVDPVFVIFLNEMMTWLQDALKGYFMKVKIVRKPQQLGIRMQSLRVRVGTKIPLVLSHLRVILDAGWVDN